MKPETNILYLGKDPDFIRELKNYCLVFMKKEVPQTMNYTSGCIVKYGSITSINLVFIDFTDLEDKVSHALEEINFIKRMPKFKSIVFVGLFKDAEQLREYPQLFVSGMQLSFVKGCETEIMFKDAFYMSFGIKGPDTQFAKAINIYKPHDIFVCSSVSRMDTTSLLIETDIETEDNLDCGLPMFPEVKARELTILTKHGCKFISPMTMSYQVNYPFADPWSENLEDCLMPETLDTWLAINNDTLDTKKGFVQVFSEDVSLVEELFVAHNSTPFHIEFLTHVILNDLTPRFELKRPDIIFYDNLQSDEEESGLLQIITTLSKMDDYFPVIIVSHSKTSSIALQKAFNYQFMLAVPGSLSGLFVKLINSFVEKKGLNERFPLGTFKPSDKRRAVDVRYKATVISLTEHELTFFTNTEIPMFSVLHLKQPLDCYVTLVPSPFNLPVGQNKFYYYGVIHGVSEEKIMLLRQFVNRLIAQPKLELAVMLEDLQLQQPIPSKEKPSVKEPELVTTQKVAQAAVETVEIRKRSNGFNIKGKTKL